MSDISVNRTDAVRAMSNPKTMMEEFEKIAKENNWNPEDLLDVVVIADEGRAGAFSLIAVASEKMESMQCLKILAEKIFNPSVWSNLKEPKQANLKYDFEAAMSQSIAIVGSEETLANSFYRSHLVEAIVAFVLREDYSDLNAVQHEVDRLKQKLQFGAGDEMLGEAGRRAGTNWEQMEIDRISSKGK